jgi:hypothetical protein
LLGRLYFPLELFTAWAYGLGHHGNGHYFNILGGNMKTRKIGNVWRVAFTDCGGNVQTAEHKSLQMALAMAFINRTTVLGG